MAIRSPDILNLWPARGRKKRQPGPLHAPAEGDFKTDLMSVRLAALLLSVLLPLPFAHGSGFRVAGQMSYSKSVDSHFEIKQTCTFEASVLGHQWLQATHLTNGQDFIQGCDGQSVYWLLVDKPAKKQLNLKTFSGNVFEGTYPIQSPNIFSTLAWLAFCSGNHLTIGVTNGVVRLPAPWLPAALYPLANIYKARFQPIADGAGLPERLEYQPDAEEIAAVRNGIFRTATSISISARDRAVVALSHYSKITEPEAVYQVTRATNCQGIVLPAEFALNRFNFRSTTNGILKKSPFERFNGQIALLEVIDTIDPLPRSTDEITNISVADYRFADTKKGVAFLGYTATNSTWLNRSDPYLQELNSKALASGLRHVSRPVFAQTLVFAIFLIIISAPLISRRIRQYARNFLKQIVERFS